MAIGGWGCRGCCVVVRLLGMGRREGVGVGRSLVGYGSLGLKGGRGLGCWVWGLGRGWNGDVG